MTNELTVGQMIFNHGQPIRLKSLMENRAGYAYWWCDTIFVEVSETKMVALPHHKAFQLLHTQRTATA